MQLGDFQVLISSKLPAVELILRNRVCNAHPSTFMVDSCSAHAASILALYCGRKFTGDHRLPEHFAPRAVSREGLDLGKKTSSAKVFDSTCTCCQTILAGTCFKPRPFPCDSLLSFDSLDASCAMPESTPCAASWALTQSLCLFSRQSC